MLFSTGRPSQNVSPLRQPSPELSIFASNLITPTNNPTSQIFKSLVYEGKVREGSEVVNLTLYGKIAIPTNPPQASYQLFPESTVKWNNKAIIHPLNSQQVPYAYPPNTPHVLHRAARVLNLKPPSDQYYENALAIARGQPSFAQTPVKGKAVDREQTLDPKLYGQVLVQNYTYCYVSPRFSMPRSAPGNSATGEQDRRRRTSFGAASTSSAGSKGLEVERGEAEDSYYVLVMELEVPIIGRPPNSPYMFILSTPTCLLSKIKLRLPPAPIPEAQSPQASRSDQTVESKVNSDVMSSDQRWDFHAEPSISRQPLISRHARRRANSTASGDGGFADDEDDDPSTLGDVHEGAFQATPTLIVRWALPQKGPGSILSRRPISPLGRPKSRKPPKIPITLDNVSSDTVYTIGAIKEFGGKSGRRRMVPVEVDFRAKASGLSYAGAATELCIGMVLDAPEDSLAWTFVENSHSRNEVGSRGAWVIDAEIGCVGYEWAMSPKPASAEMGEVDSLTDEGQSGPMSRSASASPTPAPPISSRMILSSARTESMLSEELPPTINSRTRFPDIGARPRLRTQGDYRSGTPSPTEALSGTATQLHPEGDSTSLLRTPLPTLGATPESSFENPLSRDNQAGLRRTSTLSSSGGSSMHTTASSVPLTGRLLERTPTLHSSDGSSSLLGSGSIGSAVPTDYFVSDNSPEKPQSTGSNGSAFSHLSLGQRHPSPDQPFSVGIDLLRLLLAQQAPNPSAVEFEFTIKGTFWMALPDDQVGVALPLFRFFDTPEHASKVQILLAPEAVGTGIENTRIAYSQSARAAGAHINSPRRLSKEGLSSELTLGPVGISSQSHKDGSVLLAFPRAEFNDSEDERPAEGPSRSLKRRSRSSLVASPSKPRLAALQVDSDRTRSDGQEDRTSDTISGSHELVMPSGDHFISSSSAGSQYQTATSSGQVRLPLVPHSLSRSHSLRSRTHATSSAPLSIGSLSSSEVELPGPSVERTIASVRINVIPIPPNRAGPLISLEKKTLAQGTEGTDSLPAASSTWRHIVEVKATLPSVARSSLPLRAFDFGLLQGSSRAAVESGRIEMDILSAHVKGKSLGRRAFDAPASSIVQPFPDPDGLAGDDKEWLIWMRMTLPEELQAYDGELEIRYLISPLPSERSISENGRLLPFARNREAGMEVFLPCFTYPVENVEVTYEDAEGYETVRAISNLQTKPSTRRMLRGFAQPRMTRTSLTLVQRQHKPLMGRSFGRLVPPSHWLWLAWASLVSLSLLYLIWQGQSGSSLPPFWTHAIVPPATIATPIPTAVLSSDFSPHPDITVSSEIPIVTISRPPPQPIPDNLVLPLDLWGDEEIPAVKDAQMTLTAGLPQETASVIFDAPDPTIPILQTSARPSRFSALTNPLSQHVLDPLSRFILHMQVHGLAYTKKSQSAATTLLRRFIGILITVFHYPN